jgi:hypothetical protein
MDFKEIREQEKQTPWPLSTSELYRPSDRCSSAKLVLTFEGGGYCVVSATAPYGRSLRFQDRSRYFSIKQLLSCTHETEWTPFQTHYFSENLVAPGIEPGTSRSVGRNCDH